MAMIPFLAMTPAEIQNSPILPPKIAWMGCHFSPSGMGLSNLPKSLPAQTLLILDDQTPMDGHDPEQIARQLIQAWNCHNLCGILLDFQRPESRETSDLVSYLSEVLPCPLSVSEPYAVGEIPVFLPPAPPSVPLEEHLDPWKNREIWLDLGTWGEVLTLTEEGCRTAPLPPWEFPAAGFSDAQLHCHYTVTVRESSAEFLLWRTRENLSALAEEAESIGVSTLIGLYQELRSFIP